MSNRVQKVEYVQFQVDDETARLIAALLLRVSWSEFPNAETLRDDLFNNAIDEDLEIEFDQDAGEFVKA